MTNNINYAFLFLIKNNYSLLGTNIPLYYHFTL